MSAELAAGLAAASAWAAVAPIPRQRMLTPGNRPGLGRPLARWRRRSMIRSLSADAPRLWWDVASELRAGSALGPALRAAASGASAPTRAALEPAVVAAHLGLPVADRLREVPEASFGWASAATEVAIADGAGLASALNRIGDLAAEARKNRQEQRALLAGARATSRVLLLLPLLGLVMGWGFGADPLGFLLGTAAGRACLAAAVALDVAGWLWVRALTRL